MTRGRDAMLLALTWAAGSVDALSYLGLGHVFTAMMTGNTVLLGLALAEGEVWAVLRSVLALLGFSAGAAVAAGLVERESRQEWPPAVTAALALEGGVLVLFGVVWIVTGSGRGSGAVHALIVLSGLAMGVQAAAVRRLGVPGIATTYITGTLTSLMVDLVGWLRAGAEAAGADPAPVVSWERRVGLLAAVFVVYGLGALVGAVLYRSAPTLVALVPLAAVAAVVVNASCRGSSSPQ